nr:ribonuclease H-like domain-containing protein [Tanacetum cinerariifolium]
MKMEQYQAHIDYALWEVILNDGAVSGSHRLCSMGSDLKWTRERKAKSTLLMAILDEHLAGFHGIKDAKTLWAAIKIKFGGNAESKKISPQLDNEDLKQINQDDLEEMDLKWQVVMLSMRVKRFYRKTRRKLEFNGKEPVGYEKTKVECFNCHKRYKGRDNGKRPAREKDEKALVVQDGLGTYDWSYQLEEKATDFAFMLSLQILQALQAQIL